MSVSQLVAVAVAGKSFKSRGSRVVLSKPDPALAGYVSRMNLYRYIGADVVESFNRHDPDGKFVPLHEVVRQEDVDAVSSALVDVISRQLSVDRSVPDMMNYAFGEILDNVLQHSRSPFGGAAGAQWFPTLGFVEICVADGGRGIVASMRGNPDYTEADDRDLMGMAFEERKGEWYGRTGFGDECVSGGMGLSVASNVARALGGGLWSISLGHAIGIKPSGTEAIDGLYFPGTIVCMRLPVRADTVISGAGIVDGWADEPVRWAPGEGVYYASDEEDDGLW